MKILQINRFHYIAGGASRYFFEISKVLESHGHEIAFFSMQDPRNYKSRWSKYFVDNISFEKVNLKNGVKNIFTMIYSFEARRKISDLLDAFNPDIAHIINIYHHISPSILLELKKRNIPIVHTVADYHLISPHHNNLFHGGNICEVSKIHKFYNTIIHKCVKNSYLASFAEALEQYLHYLFGFYIKNIDYFIAPSEFLVQKLIEYNIPKDKIVLLPYFIDYRKFFPDYSRGDYILFFGRLYPEKGLLFLLEVIKHLPSVKLKIVGYGPEGEKLSDKARKDKLENVEIISKFISDKNLKGLITKSAFVVLPSQSYEIFGISILEAFASGKPVIASRMGALPEVVKDGFNGYLFEPRNIEDCALKINKLWNNRILCNKMGRNARNFVMRNYEPEKHYKKLLSVYKYCLSSR